MKLNIINYHHLIIEALNNLPNDVQRIIAKANMDGLNSAMVYKLQDKAIEMVGAKSNVDEAEARNIIDKYLASINKEPWQQEWQPAKTSQQSPEELRQGRLDAYERDKIRRARGALQDNRRAPAQIDEIPAYIESMRQNGKANSKRSPVGDQPPSSWEDTWLELYEEALKNKDITNYLVDEYFGNSSVMNDIFPNLYGYVVFEHEDYIILATYLSKGATGAYILRKTAHKDVPQLGIQEDMPVQEWANTIASRIASTDAPNKLNFRDVARSAGLILFARRDKRDEAKALAAAMQGYPDFRELAMNWSEESDRLTEDVKKLIRIINIMQQMII